MVFKVKYLVSQYWGCSCIMVGCWDFSLFYLEQYWIDVSQFWEFFVSLIFWVCGFYIFLLVGCMFRFLDENKDLLINFKEFVIGMSGMYYGDLIEKFKVFYKLYFFLVLSLEEVELVLEVVYYFIEDSFLEEVLLQEE